MKQVRIYLLMPLVLASLALATGCSGPAYKTTYYTLAADRNADLRVAERYTHSLGVGPLQLPEMLTQMGVVSRTGSQRILVAPYDVWAGDLKEAMTRVLADNLSVYAGSDDVWPFPWDNRLRPEHQIRLVFERFSGERGGRVELQVKWRLLSGNGSQLLYADKINLHTETKGHSHEAYVAALNELLNRLAEHIALTIVAQDGKG